MNKLSYQIAGEKNSEGVFKAILDGKSTFLSIDVAALDVSRKSGGVCPILFCCECGMIGCDGYYANVSIADNIVTWNFFYDRFYDPDSLDEHKVETACFFSDYYNKENDFIVKTPLTFSRLEYDALADDLISLLSKYPQEKKDYEYAVKAYRLGDRFRA